ncbi:glycoside hydrolase family 105 protein [Marinilabilia salmonicolor]|uniref:Unsaturated rhamnogalacturonyl hydrolase n=1 Tax=Marinilabilia salmonicolor TaxID=989 RepID=A0A368UV39_9BACT|nr:glycoside hydrolase family 88 protein [Marinilabilia salmonicolor]RCW32533.1 unsaturated rhamnogalacturonyl hydrolase [Marinilabilia salmonicolor]
MKKSRILIALIAGFLLLTLSCTGKQNRDASEKYKSYAVQFARSEMKRFPEAWQLDHGTRYVWGYAQGLGCKAMLEVWNATDDPRYYNYVFKWADTMVCEDGSILDYEIEKYNIDYINAGKILFELYDKSGQEKFRMAMDTLLQQLKGHPQTSEGVFWHKKRYPHQIWLDGIYMAGPFMAEYGARYQRPDLIEKALHEVLITAKHTKDPETGLFFHAYDESREQKWADKETGRSPNLWGRAMGWYFMAMVDILDFVPHDHSDREKVIAVIQDFAKAIKIYQDETGLWYQVMDQGGREKNYPEASVSSMFMYALAKSVNKGYLPESYKEMARKSFEGITQDLIEENEDGTLLLTQCCAVAGLGGHPYRDGSYAYYVNERIRDNDAKATGPFIMGCLEMAKF